MPDSGFRSGWFFSRAPKGLCFHCRRPPGTIISRYGEGNSQKDIEAPLVQTPLTSRVRSGTLVPTGGSVQDKDACQGKGLLQARFWRLAAVSFA